MASDGGLRIGPWVIGSAALLGGMLLAGRASGLLREMQLAATFGVSGKADAVVILLTLPDLLVNLLLSGGLSAALIPRLQALPVCVAQVLSRQVLILILSLFGLFAVIFVYAPTLWFSLLAPGLRAAEMPPAVAIAATAIAIPLAAATGVTSASLNSLQYFFIAGCGTLIFNVVVIVALGYGHYVSIDPLVLLGIGIAFGAGLRLLSQLIALPKGWLFGPVFPSVIDSIFIRGFMATATTASLMLLVPVIVRSLASMISFGSVAALNYATKLVELPTGVLITSLSTVALVRMSALYGKQDRMTAQEILHKTIKKALSNAVGAGILIAYSANTLVELAFGRGAMDLAAIARVVNLTQLLMVGLPFLALTSVAIADLNAKEQSWDVLKITLFCLILLPFFALPGIWLSSESLLVCAIVAFQVIQALWLARKSGLISQKSIVWIDRELKSCMLAIICIASLSIFFDNMLKLLFENNKALRSIFAMMAIVAIVVIPQRYLAGKHSVGGVN